MSQAQVAVWVVEEGVAIVALAGDEVQDAALAALFATEAFAVVEAARGRLEERIEVQRVEPGDGVELVLDGIGRDLCVARAEEVHAAAVV